MAFGVRTSLWATFAGLGLRGLSVFFTRSFIGFGVPARRGARCRIVFGVPARRGGRCLIGFGVPSRRGGRCILGFGVPFGRECRCFIGTGVSISLGIIAPLAGCFLVPDCFVVGAV